MIVVHQGSYKGFDESPGRKETALKSGGPSILQARCLWFSFESEEAMANITVRLFDENG